MKLFVTFLYLKSQALKIKATFYKNCISFGNFDSYCNSKNNCVSLLSFSKFRVPMKVNKHSSFDFMTWFILHRSLFFFFISLSSSTPGFRPFHFCPFHYRLFIWCHQSIWDKCSSIFNLVYNSFIKIAAPAIIFKYREW